QGGGSAEGDDDLARPHRPRPRRHHHVGDHERGRRRSRAPGRRQGLGRHQGFGRDGREGVRRGAFPLAPALALAALPLLAPLGAGAASITDAAGRRVELADRIERVLPAGHPAAVVVYMLAPEKLVGWTRALSPAERPYIPARYADLPPLGRLTGRGSTVNLEAVLRARPDLI